MFNSMTKCRLFVNLTFGKEWGTCFWLVRALGISMTDIADRLKIAVPTVSVSAKKGEQIVSEEGLGLPRLLNIKI